MRHLALPVAASMFLLGAATTALAFDPAKYEAVKAGKQDCPFCDLSGADFTGVKISGVDLSGANLTDANLSKATFTKVDLSGADLTAANVQGTDFTDTNLKGADLDQVDLTGAVLIGTTIETAYCDWATKVPESTGMMCEGVAIVQMRNLKANRKSF